MRDRYHRRLVFRHGDLEARPLYENLVIIDYIAVDELSHVCKIFPTSYATGRRALGDATATVSNDATTSHDATAHPVTPSNFSKSERQRLIRQMMARNAGGSVCRPANTSDESDDATAATGSESTTAVNDDATTSHAGRWRMIVNKYRSHQGSEESQCS